MDDVTYLWVAETVLQKHRRPLNARELVNYGLEDGFFPATGLSRTPQKSMQARLSLDILNNPETPFVRTSRGRFFLRRLLQTAHENQLGLTEKEYLEYVAERRVALEPTESVLSIHRDNYRGVLNFQGISHVGIAKPLEFLAGDRTEYVPRVVAETLDDYKQVVTYTVIQHQSQVLSFRRGLYNRAATFLRGAQCIGFGGHVTEEDKTLFSYRDSGIRHNAAREIWEELMLPSGRPSINPDDLEYLGVLNDDSSDVGVRHLAVVLRYWVTDWDEWKRVSRGEASVNRIQWMHTAGEEIQLSQFEYWSQLVIRKFFPSSMSTVPSFKIQRRRAFRAPHVLCVLGSIGSGKSATSAFLKGECGYHEVNSGRVLAGLMGLRPVPETPRAEFQQAAQTFISRAQGPEELGRALAAAVSATGNDRVLVDGIRHPETLEALRDHCELPVGTLYVYTPPDVAYEMYRYREGHQEVDMSFHEFVGGYTDPVESRIRYMLGDADVITFNWLGLEAYEEAMEQLAEELGLA